MIFKGNPIIVDGLHISTNNPIFLFVLAIHILAALTSVIAGVFAMFANKRSGLHPKAGRVYFWSLLIVFITVTFLAIVKWKEDYYLFFLGLLSFGLAFIGRRSKKCNWPKWTIIHITCMGSSYIVLLIAFYVDNGKSLPIWKDLPIFMYWLLPIVVGLPIIVRTLIVHPLSKEYFQKIGAKSENEL